MTAVWIFQANPKYYDIDGALDALDEIWWRTPQHTAQIRPGDAALVWRAGPDAGFVAVARVMTEPQTRPKPDNDMRFALDDTETGSTDTRVLLRLGKCALVPKEAVAALPHWADHLVVKAPMGTVFAVSPEEWAVLSPLLPAIPPAEAVSSGSLPSPFAWAQRTKSVHPMPGGYDGYLTSLRQICAAVIDRQPALDDMPQIIAEMFSVTDKRSELLEGFLRKVSILTDDHGSEALTDWAARWFSTGDDRIVIALLHSRTKFIGEFLHATRSPITHAELLGIANTEYGLGWDTEAQITRRRGWLQSAGFITVNAEQRLVITAAGEALLQELTLEAPGIRPTPADVPATEPAVPASWPAPVLAPPTAVQPQASGVDELADELTESSVDSSNPDRFERAVARAFAYLGFHSKWIGGSGNTDVLVDSPPSDAPFRLIVDCKTSASGAVTDGQVDWITLKDHKVKHKADNVAVVAPNPSGSRLFERAKEQGVTVMSCAQLVNVCRQHAAAPLGYRTYQRLFDTPGAADISAAAEDAEEWLRHASLARLVLSTLRERSGKLGRLSAHDIFVILSVAGEDGATESEVHTILSSLASPLLALVDGGTDGRYVVTTTPEVVTQKLASIAEQLRGE